MIIKPLQIIEGTWEEIAELAPKLRGYRLRVTILPATQPEPNLLNATTRRYAARMKASEYLSARLAAEATDAPEEIRQAEAELEELKRSMKENRRIEGAESIF